MDRKKSVIRAGAVLAVALAAGHLVQTLHEAKATPPKAAPEGLEQVSAGSESADATIDPALAAPSLVTPAAAAVAPAPAVAIAVIFPPLVPQATGAEAPVLAALPATEASPAPSFPALPPLAVLPAPDFATDEPPAAAAPESTADACAVALSLAARPKAMIAVTLTAPCRADERVVLRHAGLVLAERLSGAGTLALDLPAFDPRGEVSALFADAAQARAAIAVPEAGSIRRFAVQWMAADSFQLYALEGGREYGQPGGVSLASPASAEGGSIVALGNADVDLPMMAQVYTWPADPATSAEVLIEAEVTETTCGRELLGETIETGAGGVIAKDLTIAMPGCDALGDIMVLKNPGQDVTLTASN